MYNNPEDNAVYQSRLQKPTTALHGRLFTTIGLLQTLTKFVAQKASIFSNNHYDHAIARYMKYTIIEEADDTCLQLKEKFFIKSEYIFGLDSKNKKYDDFSSTSLTDKKRIILISIKFNHFSLTFRFLTPKECDLDCSHELLLCTKLTHTHTYYKFIQHHYTTNAQARNPQHRFNFINAKYTSP